MTRFDISMLDVTRHAVLEASAGTGKTYTIERLVLRLVLHEAVPPENLLIVTFTEKATGELKDRIRRTLVKALADGGGAAVASALEHFDQMPIFTIHGFCQRLLQEFALEQGQDVEMRVVDDQELLRRGLREVQRKDWRRQYGPALREVLQAADYSRNTAERWDKDMLAVAAKFKPRAGHQLRPAACPEWWQHLGDLEVNVRGLLEVDTIRLLQTYLVEFKRQRGMLSYDDMIGLVEENLDPAINATAEIFLQSLRERYRFGIIDEFQDTDPLQWRIFERIFLAGGSSRLIVVGDPKQAIFGFRGGDLPTYLQAAETLRVEHQAQEQPLRVNWRSDPALIEALNCVFADGEWFQDTGIRFLAAQAPEPEERQSTLIEDRTNRAALTLVDLRQFEVLRTARKSYARFIAQEIRKLLSGDEPKLILQKKQGPPRPLDAGDICLLVQKRRDAEPLIAALTQLGIPYSFYKQSGLWHSDEALQIEAVLRFLAQADDPAALRKALLTRFFRVRPEELVHGQDVPPGHPARLLFQHWLACAEGRQWSALFQSLLENTGVLIDVPRGGDVDRRLANLRHLAGVLEQVGHEHNLDLLGLREWMRERRNVRDPGDGDLQPAETQSARVQIMTIHASKGLEYPVVFLAGGFTQASGWRDIITYRDDQGRLVFDLAPGGDAEQRVKQEQLSEQKRLLYVALTRAIFKLYVPWTITTPKNKPHAGPVGLVLAPALELACPDKLGPLVAETIKPSLLPEMPLTAAPPGAASRAPLTLTGELFPTVDPSIRKRRKVARSFSSLSRQYQAELEAAATFGDERVQMRDETPVDAEESEEPLRGPVLGDMVHGVLEAIDFADAARADSAEALARRQARLIDAQVRAHVAGLRGALPADQLEPACRRLVAQLVWQALHTPLRTLGGPLAQVPAEDRIHEVEFTFPERPGPPPTTRQSYEEGFLKGYIDLVVRRGERYFLVDWKTNVLASYGPDSLARCMVEADYRRQYRIYLHALERWLRCLHGPRFNFKKQFAGIYYLFVRGMNGVDETAGVHFHVPTAEDLDLSRALSR